MITNLPCITPEAMSDNETLIALLDIKAKIQQCRAQEGYEPWLIPSTLRHKAMELAAAFVDPHYQEGPGHVMAKQIDDNCGF